MHTARDRTRTRRLNKLSGAGWLPHDRGFISRLPRSKDERRSAAPAQYAPRQHIAGLGDAAEPHAAAGGMLAGHQPEIGRQMSRIGEAAKIADLGDDGHRDDKYDAAHRLQAMTTGAIDRCAAGELGMG